jgi:hypothetical protein
MYRQSLIEKGLISRALARVSGSLSVWRTLGVWFSWNASAMTTRLRVLTFGGAGLLVVAGVACAVAIGGGAGQILAPVLVGIGFVLAVSLVFYEVGLSEDRDRVRMERSRAAASGRRFTPAERRLRPMARLDRMRGRHRRLR